MAAVRRRGPLGERLVTRRWLHRCAVALLVVGLSGAAPAGAQEGVRPSRTAWVVDLLAERAAAHGVAAAPLVALARCESSLDPGALGDRGRSHGLIQLNDRPTGLLDHFHRAGYATAYSAWQSADYLARVAAGEFAEEAVTLRRWSCWRRVR